MSAPFAGLVLALCVYACVPCCAADTNYSQPLLNESYVSNPRFVARGLAPLYDGVSVFLRGIQKHDILPEGLLHVKNGSIEVNTNLDYGSVALFYIGILVLLCIGLAVVLIAPFIGLIWCCSCCTSNKRRRHRRLEDDERGHREKQERRPRGPVCAPMILAAITGVIVAGVAIALAANAYIDDGIVGLGHHVASGTADIRLYVDNAHTEVDTILDINYNELSSGLHSVLEGSRTETNNLVDEFIKFLPLDTIDSMATGIETIQTDLVDISSTIQTCMDTSDDIVQEIEFIRKTLDQVCANLGSSCPTELSSFNQNLSPPNFQQLPKAEIEKSMQDLTTIIPKEFKENLKRGREEVDSLGTRTQQIFNDVSTQMNVTILQTGENLKQKGSEFVQAATNATDSLVNVDNKVSDFQDYYKQSYQFYRVIAFTAYIAVVLVIAALITIGLVCGGCSSKHSYTFLNVPVFLILLTISVWMLIVMALFVTGVATDRACEFLRQPGDHQLSYLVDEMLQHYRDGVAEGSQLPPLHNISYYISECRMDKTMYEVIDLESTIQIDNIFNYIDEFDFNSYLKDVDEALDKVVNVKIIPKNVIDQIVELKNSEVSQLDLTKLLKELDEFENTVGQLIGAGWEQQLEKIASQYTTISVNQQVTDLKQVAEKAEKLQQSAKLLAEILERFSDDIKLGHESFPFALQWLLDQASQTDQMVTDTAPRIRKIAEDTANGFKTEVAAYLNRSVERVKLHALRCKPIINIYDTMVMGVCDEIIAPWNAFWAMSGFCLLLLIPAAFFSNYLSSY